jgi:hypothetical protein
MHYQTIVLELLKETPALHRQLCTSRTLLSTVENYAIALKASHDSWKDSLSHARPQSDRNQIASQAMELAIQELRVSLPSESATDETEPFSLDAAIAFISRHTPPA